MKEAFGIAGDNAWADVIARKSFTGDFKNLCKQAVDKSGLHSVREMYRRFPDGSQYVMHVLSESAVIAKCGPSGLILSISVYTCGKEGKPDPALDVFCAEFEGATITRNRIARGDVPTFGIRAWRKAGNQPEVLRIADNLYKGKISDDKVFSMVYGAVARYADRDNIAVLRHDFKPQGMTMVIVAMDKQSRFIEIDVHTYPENMQRGSNGASFNRPYVSISVKGNADLVNEVSRHLHRQDMPLVAANQSSFPRLAIAA